MKGADWRKGRSHTQVWWLRIRSNISTAKVLPEKQRVPAPHPAPSQSQQCQEENSPQHMVVKISGDSIWIGGLLEFWVFLLQGPHMNLLNDGLTYSELKCWSSSSKSTRDKWGKKELSGYRARTGGAAVSRGKKLLVGSTVLLLSPPTKQLAGGPYCFFAKPFPNPSKSEILSNLPHPSTSLNLFQWLFLTNCQPWRIWRCS